MAGRRTRPLIGVTGPRRGSFGPRVCVALGLRLARARVVQLRPGRTVPIDELDGAVLTGGHDVEPVLYRASAEVEGRYDTERDRFELEVLQALLDRGRPVLGICRGAQLLNVRLGGTLRQDLTSVQRSHARTLLPLSSIELVAGSRLADTLGVVETRVNVLHDQAIDELGRGLRVVARDSYDLVQGVESEQHAFALGVQWHPEFLLYRASERRLFRALVEAASHSAGAR